MTAEFNIDPTTEMLLDRIKQLELTVSANAHQQDADHDRLIELEGHLATHNHIINQLSRDVEQLEDAAGWKEGANMENATEPSISPSAPEPLEDNKWYGHNYYDSHEAAPTNKRLRIEVLTRGNRHNFGFADTFNWDWGGDDTIVAWRYAKAGE